MHREIKGVKEIPGSPIIETPRPKIDTLTDRELLEMIARRVGVDVE